MDHDLESPMDVLGQPSANEGQYFGDRDASTLIRALLAGNPLDSPPPEAFSPYRDVITNLRLAHEAGGTATVRRAWLGMVARNPALGALAAAEATASPGWPVFTLADAYRPRPPLTYVVDGLLPLPSVSIVYGAPGTLKSLLLADMGMCVAAGLPWLPAIPSACGQARSTVQSPVLWCDFDNGVRRTHARFEALARAQGLPVTTPFRYVSMPSPWLDAGRPDGMAMLREAIEATGTTLVIIDNLSTVRGTVDENSPEMAGVMARFRQLVEDYRLVLCIIHHQRKAYGTETRAGDRIRGHSSIEAALDVALLVERPPDADAVTVRMTKARDVAIAPFGAQFVYDHKPGTKELLTARFFALAAEDDRSDRRLENAIIEAVRANPHLNQGCLKQAVKAQLPRVGLKRIGDVIDRLARQEELNTTPGPRGAIFYDLPS
jgi:hypothetical protein